MTEDISGNDSKIVVPVPDNSNIKVSHTVDGDLQCNIDAVNSDLLANDLNNDNGCDNFEVPESVNNGIHDDKSFRITSVSVKSNSINLSGNNVEDFSSDVRGEEISDSELFVDNMQTITSDYGYTQNIIRKDDVLYKVTSLGSAPIIPTSAQYGIAVVSNPNAELADNVNKFVADNKLTDCRLRSEYLQNGLNGSCGANLTTKDFNSKNERFKVVKIESNEPFKRGRWVCMDFLDQSMDQIKRAANATADNKTCKSKESLKESSPEIQSVNGVAFSENLASAEACYSTEVDNFSQTQVRVAPIPNECASHTDSDASNVVSTNQTFTTPFMSKSNFMQAQSHAQSLTHIVIPQGCQSSSVVGVSCGHSQSIPLSDLQYSQISQQPMQTNSLQQSFVTHANPQASTIIPQNIHLSNQQSESIMSQNNVQPQSYPVLQQQSSTNQSTHQRAGNGQLIPSQCQMSNHGANLQLSQTNVPSSTTNNKIEPSILQQQGLQVMPSQTPTVSNQNFQSNQQQSQNIQQTYSQQGVPTQSMSQPNVLTSAQQLSSQHHSPQGNQSSVHQITSQPSIPQANSPSSIQSTIHQPSHLPASVPLNQSSSLSSAQYAPQQSSVQQLVMPQSTTQQNPQNVLPQSLQSHSQQMTMQNITGSSSNGNSGCGNDSQHLLQQQQQQQQIQQSQTMPSHPQSLQHITSQPPSQQQITLQQTTPSISSQHHMPVLHAVSQPQSQAGSQINMHQTMNLQNVSSAQTLSSQPQIIQTSLQSLPQPQTQQAQHSLLSSHPQIAQQTSTLQSSVQGMQPLQSSIIGSQNQALNSNGNQSAQTQYQNSPNQINDINIPLTMSQTSYQHDAVLSNLPQHDAGLPNLSQPDLLLPNQYSQTQNTTPAHALYVSTQQSYPSTLPASQYANTSNINLVPTCVSNQQPSQYYSQQIAPSSQPNNTINSQSQDVTQGSSQALQNVANVAQLSSVSTTMSTAQGVAVQHTNQNVSHQGQHPSYPVTSQMIYSQSNVTPSSMPSISSLASGIMPVSTAYVTNSSAVHPTQLSSTATVIAPSCVASLQQSVTHVYAVGQNSISTPQFIEGFEEPQNRVNLHLQEQVVECTRTEETSIQRSNEDSNSTSNGNSSVAIDNKIEQAMDLVKSHLMFAVREEVEVLKEKIAELMDRINQLEIENSILKSNATQETLAQLPLHQSSNSCIVSISNSSRPTSITISANNNINTTSNHLTSQ